LYVQKSKIPEAGLGLFTAISRKKGDKLFKYEGEVLKKSELDDRYPGDVVAPYTLRIGKNYVDARSTQSGFARMMNGCDSPLSEVKCNVRVTKSGWFYMTENVSPKTELYWPYGEEYWL
jgi:hypothetical protein